MISALVSKTRSILLANHLNEPSLMSVEGHISEQETSETHLSNPIMSNNNEEYYENLQGTIFDCIRTIRDPEKPASLEDLQVVYESGVKVKSCSGSRTLIVDIEFNPTVPHCSLATLIGLCMRVKVERSLVENVKLDIHIKKGAHDTEDEINKQINDKERVAAAMENPNLKEMVEKCITEDNL